MTVNAPVIIMSVLASKLIRDEAANSGFIPFSLKNTTDGGFSLDYLNIISP